MNKNSKKADVLLLTETNLILDITFEQSQQCERLLFLASEQNIQVVIPEYSFAEAEGNIGNTIQKRLSAIDSAISALRQSARSAYQDLAMLINQLQQFKAHSEAEELPVLHTRMEELEESVSVIPFSAEVAARAELRGLRQLAPFKQTDQKIYESILQFARENQSPDLRMLFLTRDKADFDFPYIQNELASLSVEFFFSAGECIRRIRELLGIS